MLDRVLAHAPRVHAQQNSPGLDDPFPLDRFGFGQTCLHEHRGQVSNDVTSGFAKLRGQRTGRHNRSGAGQSDRDGRKEEATQFSKPRSRARILDLDPRRRADLVGNAPLGLMIRRHNGEIGFVDAELVHLSRRNGSGRPVAKEADQQRMRHCYCNLQQKPPSG